jgi:hypothetical protein
MTDFEQSTFSDASLENLLIAIAKLRLSDGTKVRVSPQQILQPWLVRQLGPPMNGEPLPDGLPPDLQMLKDKLDALRSKSYPTGPGEFWNLDEEERRH